MNNMNQKSNFNQVNNKNTQKPEPIWVRGQTRPFLDDFVKIKQLGRAGQYGVTYKCARKSDGKSFAVKFLNKNRFNTRELAKPYLTAMLNEISILNILKHENIVNLECVYEDTVYLYIVMEECKGGELFDRITKRKRYSEKDAKHVISQLLSSLRYMHDDRNIIHCDIKPDNILFADDTEHSTLKLIDFGMSKILPRLQYATNICGSIYYMAPEITQKKIKYNQCADMWSVGVLLFVMIYGYPPFYVPSQNDEERERKLIYAKIQNGFDATIKSTKKYGYGAWFPDHIKTSQEVRDLISKLLQNDTNKRYTAKEALCHSWFANSSDKQNDMMESIMISRLLRYNKDDAFKSVFSTIFRNKFYEQRGEHYEQLQELFVKYDKDGDGILSFDEFQDMIKSMDSINIDDKDMNTIHLRLCTIPSIGITFHDLLNALVYDYVISSDERINIMFKQLDNNNNGQISLEQLKENLLDIDPYNKTWDDILKSIQSSCIDPNGGLFFDELLLKLHPKFEQIPSWIPNLFSRKQ